MDTKNRRVPSQALSLFRQVDEDMHLIDIVPDRKVRTPDVMYEALEEAEELVVSQWMRRRTLEEIERFAIEGRVKFYRDRKPSAAKSLGISLRTLYNKLDRYASRIYNFKATKERLGYE